MGEGGGRGPFIFNGGEGTGGIRRVAPVSCQGIC